MQYFDVVIFLLVFIRMISFLAVSPIYMIKGIPNITKIGLGLILTIIIYKFVPYDSTLLPQSLIALSLTAIGESVFGLALGFITTLVFQGIRMSGQLMDIDIGFSMASEYDITNSTNVTILGNITYLTAIFLFFVINGHHILIRALIQSFDIIPLLGVNIPTTIVPFTVTLFTKTFILSLKLAAPIIVVVFLTDFTLGLISRSVPQINIFMLELPVKIVVGLLALTAIFPIIINLYIKAFEALPKDIDTFFKLFPLVILFASEDKTEEATPKKKEDAKKKGQSPKSRDFISALTLISVVLIASTFGNYQVGILEKFFNYSISNLNTFTPNLKDVNSVFINTFIQFFKVTMPIFLGIMLTGVIANIIQTGFVLSGEPLKPKLSRLNPIEGFKRMFSGKTFVQLLKTIAIILIIGYVAFDFIKDELNNVLLLSDMSTIYLLEVPYEIAKSELTSIAIVVLIIGIVDLLYQKLQYNKEMRMTKQEIKEEYKQMEGDPKIKSAIRQKQRAMASKRMMSRVPEASVVVTNPTHIAVALKYEQGKDKIPVVIAKGADEIARKIREVAKENKIAVIENKPLAWSLYRKVEIDEEVPYELYQAVAEILALVYNLNRRRKVE